MTPEDRAALSDLVHRYALHVDRREFERVAALFTADGVLATAQPPKHLDPMTEHVGPEGVLEAMAGLALVPRTFHAIVGEVYDAGSGAIACIAHHVLPDVGNVVWHLRYADSYCRTEQGWLFDRREVHVDLVETRPLPTFRA